MVAVGGLAVGVTQKDQRVVNSEHSGAAAMALQIEGALSFGLRDRDEIEVREQARREHARGPIFGVFATALLLILGISVVAFVLLPRGIGSDAIEGLASNFFEKHGLRYI